MYLVLCFEYELTCYSWYRGNSLRRSEELPLRKLLNSKPIYDYVFMIQVKYLGHCCVAYASCSGQQALYCLTWLLICSCAVVVWYHYGTNIENIYCLFNHFHLTTNRSNTLIWCSLHHELHVCSSAEITHGAYFTICTLWLLSYLYINVDPTKNCK